MTIDSDVPLFPMPRTTPFDPPEGYTALSAHGPARRGVMPSGQSVWLITGHENVRRILADPRISSNRRHPSFPMMANTTPEMRAAQAALTEALVSADPPAHTTRRRLLITEFTVRRVQALQPRIQEIVDNQIDALLTAGPPADLFADFALPVPSLVICELLGVPYSDREFFQTRTHLMIAQSTPPAERYQATGEMYAYFNELIAGKEADPTDDLLGRLIVRDSESADGRAFDHQLLVGLATLLLIAGHETTSNVISLGTLALLQHPDQLARLMADPSLVTGTVEELLRYLSIVEAGFRVALADIEVGDTVIRAGEALVTIAGSANRDDAAFEHADEFDITRGARHHVSFGYGIHQCLGQNLARTELEVAFRTLFRRMPGLRLAVPVDEVPFKDDSTIYGVNALPVTW
ncbi:MAG TPA: cytochrome P450 [Pseudonocardiaceae bacterium]|nr:cytochrome P450 [Pseudonocardiaceae bacterium]